MKMYKCLKCETVQLNGEKCSVCESVELKDITVIKKVCPNCGYDLVKEEMPQ